jgi:Flp pilus assembly protein TadD
MNASFRKFFKPAAFCFLLQMILIGSAAAQFNTNRDIRGAVKDAQGQPIQGATVQASKVEGGFKRTATTNAKGEFIIRLGDRNPGSYYVGARKVGFEPGYVKGSVKPEPDEMPPVVQIKLNPGKDEQLWWEMSIDEQIKYINYLKGKGGKITSGGKVKKLFDNGVAAYNDGKYDEAIKFLTEASQQGPKEKSVWFDLGLCYSKKELYNEALAAFEKAIELDAGNYEYIVQKAEVLYKLQKLDEAEQTFLKAAAIAEKKSKTDAARCYTNIGIMMDNLEKYDKAVEFYKRAVDLDPKFAEAHFSLGRLYLRNDETVCDALKELTAFIGLGIGESNPEDRSTARKLLEEYKDNKCPN